jgi:hypothetical protein
MGGICFDSTTNRHLEKISQLGRPVPSCGECCIYDVYVMSSSIACEIVPVRRGGPTAGGSYWFALRLGALRRVLGTILLRGRSGGKTWQRGWNISKAGDELEEPAWSSCAPVPASR